jgi:hypothetical protein
MSMAPLRCLLLAAAALVLFLTPAGGATAPAVPRYGDSFWSHWGDGQAEIAAYDLVIPRYGELRQGTAVAIFVTEPFGEAARVKSDRPTGDDFQVLKLNLMRDFATGVYDYNLMTSVFLALEPRNGRPAGVPTKISFSSQEWCGQVWEHALFDRGRLRVSQHSYFQGEGDAEPSLDLDAGGSAADALLLWARGLAYPLVDAGASAEVSLLSSLERSRLDHVPLSVPTARLARSAESMEVKVPAGSFTVRVATATIPGAGETRFFVEEAAPHRVVRWESSTGERAELVGVDRLAYWKLNGPEGVAALERIGLRPRPARTP